MTEWTPGRRHANTPYLVFRNVWEWDVVRRTLKGRCHICGYVLSDDEVNIRELLYDCGDREHCKPQAFNTNIVNVHEVCNLCYDMFHALYVNFGMKNRNYFKNIDDKERRDVDNSRRRGGLSD